MNASSTVKAGAAAPSASRAGAKSSPSPSRMLRRRAAASTAAAASVSASDSGASSSSPSSGGGGNSPPRAKTVRSVSPQHQQHSSSRARSHQVGSPPPLGATSDVNSSFSSSAAAAATATTAATAATKTSKKSSTSSTKKSTKKASSSPSTITRDWDSSWASADEPWANGEVIYVNDADLEQQGGDVEGEFRAFGFDDDDDEGDDNSHETKGKKKRLPAEMRCFDTARIYVKGGDGGKGCVAFRREKFVPKGGPSGGDGGDGGHVYAVADASLTSLAVFRRQLHFRAPGGDHGGGSKCRGANASHIEVRVPPGTIFRKRKSLNGGDGGSASARAGGSGGANGGNDEYDDELDPPIAELVSPGERALLAVGGKGGRGNASFKTHKNNAPTMAELGEPGEEWWLDVELRLVADVGIVGVPNAGKSSLLSALSAAKPKVANYPFTTLVPQLGVCELDYRSTVFADVPGLLEGAHAGVGLGHEFLRHVSRCRAAVHVVDGSSRDPVGDYAAVRAELELFSPELAALPQVVAYNKVDLPDSADYFEDVRAQLAEEAHGVHPDDVIAVSAATGTGVPELVRRVRALLDELAEEAWAEWEEEERSRRKRERAEALGGGGGGGDGGGVVGLGGVSGFRLGDKSAFDDDDDDDEDFMGAGGASSPLLAAPPPGRDDFFPGQSASGFGSSSSSSSARSGRAPGSLPPRRATNALNLQEPVRAKNPLSSAAARGGKIGDYSVVAGRDDGGSRIFKVSGVGIDRFVAMTNWNYYESALRFQKVLEASGIVDELKAQGVKPGDTVSVGGNEFLWSDDRSDGALYEAWMTDRRASGRVMQGSHAWPHGGG